MITISSSSSRRAKRRRSGMRLTARDVELLTALYVVRELTGRQVKQLLFANLSDSVYQRRLTLLTRHDFLHASPWPFGSSVGSCPYRYALGYAACELLPPLLHLPRRAVTNRVRQDQRLLPSPHLRHVVDCYIAYRRACEEAGYRFAWKGEAELARANQFVQLDGSRTPIRADAFLTIDVPRSGKASAFLEFQNISSPKKYRAKVAAYRAYYQTGAYTTWSGFKAPFRVLGVTETLTRATNLQAAAEVAANECTDLFWSAPLRRIIEHPLGPVWLVAGQGARLHQFLTSRLNNPTAP